MWKILPLFLFAAVALLGFRYGSRLIDAKRASLSGTTESSSALAASNGFSDPDDTALRRESAARTFAALGGLTANSSAEDLVKALNLMIIDFSPGSSEIPADQMEVLKQSAEAIKTAPSGTRLEVGAHTDNQGEAGENLKISEARAEAVKEFLFQMGVPAIALTSKGYGHSRPVASNDTADGRFKNRRIEFSIVR